MSTYSGKDIVYFKYAPITCNIIFCLNKQLCFTFFRIGAHAFSLLEKENIYSSGLILEAPFNKMSEAIRQYSTAKVTNTIYKSV